MLPKLCERRTRVVERPARNACIRCAAVASLGAGHHACPRCGAGEWVEALGSVRIA